MPFTALILSPIHPEAATAVRELGALGEIRTYLTTPESSEPEQMARTLPKGAGSVVVTGGDGTQRFVVGALTGTGMPLGILAAGTACVYSRSLGLPCDLADAALAMTGIPRSMDLGWASLDGGSPKPFLVATGMGRDAETFLGVRNNLKERLGWAAYVRTGLGTMGRHRLFLRVNERPIETWTVLTGGVGRIPTASLFPGARPDDGRLHVMHLEVDGWRD